MTPEEFSDRLETVAAALYELMNDVDASGIGGADQDLAASAAHFHSVLSDAKDLYNVFCSDVIQRIEYTPVPIKVDGATVEIKGGSKRKAWDHRAAATDVAKRIVQSAHDPDTGERLLTPEDMILEMLKYAGVQYWKVKPMSELGLTVGMYCEESEGPKNLIVRKDK